jgi:hypothetical protein
MNHKIESKVLGYIPQLCIIDAKGLSTCSREVGKNELMRTGTKIISMVNHNPIVGRVSV